MLRSRVLIFVTASLLLICKPASAAIYTVTLDAKEANIHVNACFDHLPDSLSTGYRRSADFLDESSLKHARLSFNQRRLRPTGAPCINYRVDLNDAKAARQARFENDAWLVNNRSWLWRPESAQQIELHFVDTNLRPIQVSAPWPVKSIAGKTHYVVGDTPIGWTSRMAFGNVTVKPVPVAEQHLNVAMVGIDYRRRQDELADWIAEAAGAVATLYGRYPIHQAQVLVVPIGRRSEAVPWAEVQRAGRPAVHLFIDPHRPIEEFRQDWTAVHEFSHLLHPRIEYRDRWISEGLASYYQHVSKARAGMFTVEQGWKKLRAGFARGRKVESGTLRTSKQTRHIYWGGAAIFLLADLRLREMPQPLTLDEVLGRLQACCLPSDRLWSAQELMAKLDALSDSQIFTALLNNEAIARSFPVSMTFESIPDPLLQKHKHAIFGKRQRQTKNRPSVADDD